MGTIATGKPSVGRRGSSVAMIAALLAGMAATGGCASKRFPVHSPYVMDQIEAGSWLGPRTLCAFDGTVEYSTETFSKSRHMEVRVGRRLLTVFVPSPTPVFVRGDRIKVLGAARPGLLSSAVLDAYAVVGGYPRMNGEYDPAKVWYGRKHETQFRQWEAGELFR